MTRILQSLSSGFLRSAVRFSDREALNVAGRGVTYQELAERAKRLAATLQAGGGAGEATTVRLPEPLAVSRSSVGRAGPLLDGSGCPGAM